MHLQINPTYLILGAILVIVGLLAQRIISRRQHLPVMTVDKPMRIGFHVGEDPNDDLTPPPQSVPLPAEDLLTTKKQKRPSLLEGLLASLSRRSQKKTKIQISDDAPTLDEDVASAPMKAPDPNREANIAARVNNVPRQRNPLRFSTKRIPDEIPKVETADIADKPVAIPEPTPESVKQTYVTDEYVDVSTAARNGAGTHTLPAVDEDEHVTPALQIVRPQVASVADVTDALIAHVLGSDPVVAVKEPPHPDEEDEEEIVAAPIYDATAHIEIEDIPIIVRDEQPPQPLQDHTIDLDSLVIPASPQARTIELDDEDDIPVRNTSTPSAIEDDEDDGPIDFSGGLGFNDEERRKMLEEMEEDEIAQAELENNDEDDETDEDMSLTPSTVATPSVIAIPPRQDSPPALPATLLPTFRWTTFMGEDAQALGVSERANLVRMLRDQHDTARCLPILMEAFNEEDPQELRPAVFEAITHSYSQETLRPLYEYCLEDGSDREKELASEALKALG